MIGPGPSPAVRPRPTGGFSQGMGAFGEHMDEAAMQAAMKQKTLQQQQTTAPTQVPGQSGSATPAQPRAVGSFTDELIKRPAQDVVEGLGSFVDINELLGIKDTDTPEQKQKKQAFHQKYQQLTADEKEAFHEAYQKEMQRKKAQVQQDEAAKQRKAQEAEQSAIAVPSSPQRGPEGPGGQSKKKSTVNMLNQQRKGLSNPGQQH